MIFAYCDRSSKESLNPPQTTNTSVLFRPGTGGTNALSISREYAGASAVAQASSTRVLWSSMSPCQDFMPQSKGHAQHTRKQSRDLHSHLVRDSRTPDLTRTSECHLDNSGRGFRSSEGCSLGRQLLRRCNFDTVGLISAYRDVRRWFYVGAFICSHSLVEDVTAMRLERDDRYCE